MFFCLRFEFFLKFRIEVDADGSGIIDRDEFDAALENKKVLQCLTAMGLTNNVNKKRFKVTVQSNLISSEEFNEMTRRNVKCFKVTIEFKF